MIFFSRVAYTFGKETDSGDRILACWTPVEYVSKTSAMQLLFPHKLAVLDVTLEQLPPPSVRYSDLQLINSFSSYI